MTQEDLKFVFDCQDRIDLILFRDATRIKQLNERSQQDLTTIRKMLPDMLNKITKGERLRLVRFLVELEPISIEAHK